MLDPLPSYLLVTFIVGIACLSMVLFLAFRRNDPLARAFLAFYAALSLLVAATLLLVFEGGRPGGAGWLRPTLVYLESFVGTYAVVFTMPYFAHRVYAVEGRDRALLAVAVVALVAQHVTELVLGDPWDARGDVAENVLFVGVGGYVLWLAATRWRLPSVPKPLAGRLFLLLLLGAPSIAYELWLGEATGWRLYPAWYCLLSIVLTVTLLSRPPDRVRRVAGEVPAGWELSEREREVVGLLRRGLSNREIGGSLHISTNTVKTHLRAIFDKSGVRSRFALLAALSAPAGAHDREDAGPPS